MSAELLEQVRHRAGLSQRELAERCGTSRPTLSAYEHGRKSPTLATVERLLSGAGFELAAEPTISFREMELPRGRPIFVPNQLWRLPIGKALAPVTLPLELNWSQPGSTFDLGNRQRRARCYEIVLREGMPEDLRRFVDGALLVDLWADLVLPADVRAAWQGVIDEATG